MNATKDTFVSPAKLLQRYNLRAKKHWGQNFLHDASVVRAIADAAQIEPNDTVVEIGAGLGAMTGILAQRAARVIAVERDRELAAVLRDVFGQTSNIEVAETNALTFSFLNFDEPVVVVGNLPFHISSPLIFHLLDQRQHIRAAIVMLQREPAQRLVAEPGSRVYGAPSVTCQQYADLSVCLQVKRGAFLPPPRVDSTVIRLRMRTQPLGAADPVRFRAVVRAAFARRRKMLRRALAAQYPVDAVERALADAEIASDTRAECLSVLQFVRLTNALERHMASETS